MQKTVESLRIVWYGVFVKAKSLTGFDSPNSAGGRTATSFSLAVFLRPLHSIALTWAVVCGGLRARRVPVDRSVNPHIAALFAFDSAKAVHFTATGAMP